ncbi:MAG: SDR family NAD(P)-dependent oxidoreductase [Chloroflexota bacterium]
MKTAVVWGAAGGIGQALVAKLVNEGWQTIALVHRPLLTQMATPHVIDANVCSPYEIELAVQSIKSIVEEVNLWIYSVGDITSVKIAEMLPDQWQTIIDANLTGAFLTTHYSLPILAHDAHLIYVGAVSERLRLPGLSAYGVAKSGLEAFVETLRKEERKKTVTLVRPSAVDTAFWDKVPMKLPHNSLSVVDVANQVIDVHQNQRKGVIDL